LTAFVLRAWPTGRVLDIGAVLLTAGTTLTLVGVLDHSLAMAGAGTLVAGVGFGASALACFGTLSRLAAPEQRGELFAVAYLAFSLPAVFAGFASASVGLRSTALVYDLGVVTLGLTALVAQRVRSNRRGGVQSDGANRPDRATHHVWLR
jgi:hypothetical protein